MSTYSIQEVSRMFDLNASTLRYYEEIGILTNVGRNEKKQRVYEQCHLNRLGAICCFKGAGMSMAQLQKFFTYERDEEQHVDEMLELLSDQKHYIEDQLEKLKQNEIHIDKKLRFYTAVKQAQLQNKPRPEWKDYQ